MEIKTTRDIIQTETDYYKKWVAYNDIKEQPTQSQSSQKPIICSTCKKEVNDIRPQIEGIGVCVDCEITEETLEKWKKLSDSKSSQKITPGSGVDYHDED